MRRKNQNGFTLIEMLIIVAILGILAATAIPKLLSAIEKARIARAIAEISSINKAITIFKMEKNHIPDKFLSELTPTYMSSIPDDPWNNSYKYYNHETNNGNGTKRMDGPIVPINQEFDLYSEGPNLKSTPTIRSNNGKDDIIFANDGDFIGIAEDY